MKAIVKVMLKSGVLDPQGEAINSALGSLGFSGVNSVRQGKVIELNLADGTLESEIDEMCRRLLVNAVIESYTVEVL
ncbi:MAG: phosphoribosylformylglycinamidine synthase subunit PurS [Planktomarina sp.]|nr:phosphoribosylformylglycinamidine synthase subunit PurS [Planktomarina sp.]